MKKCFLLILIWLPILCVAQHRNDVSVYLNNGNKVVGQIIEDGQTTLTLRKDNGEIQTFRKIEINKIIGPGEESPRKASGKYVDYTFSEQKFWCAVEISTGVNLHVTSQYQSSYTADLAFTGGYRFDKYLQLGLGVGVRRYMSGNDRVYYPNKNPNTDVKTAFPIFMNARGIMIDSRSRNAVPYWSANIGYTIFDGFYFAPCVGLRVGSTTRNHFLVGIGYTLQCVKATDLDNAPNLRNLALNAIVLKMGYQF